MQFIVEMQLHWDESFKSRVLLNASKAYVMQLEKAQKVKLIQPVYALNFVNDVFEKSPEMEHEYYHYYKIVNMKHTEKQIKGLEFIFVELPKFKPQNRAEKKLHGLWLRFLTEINENTIAIPKEMMRNKHIREAIGYMERSAYTKEELDAYQQWRINAMTATAMIENAREEGEAIGFEKGEAERAKLRNELEAAQAEKEAAQAEKQAALKCTVINCYHAGLSVETISSIAGLTPDQIAEILKMNDLT
jgi:predicted transposase/invertase (TIGR01784 family)